MIFTGTKEAQVTRIPTGNRYELDGKPFDVDGNDSGWLTDAEYERATALQIGSTMTLPGRGNTLRRVS